MHRLIQKFDTIVRVVILGEGITSRSAERQPEEWRTELAEHRANIEAARVLIGFETVRTYDFPDNRFDSIDLLDVVKAIEREITEFSPHTIFTHHGGDVNIDHQRTFEAVVTACRPMQDQVVRQIVTFPTASGTEWRASTDPRHFIPNLYIGVSETDIEIKIKAMECYVYEKRAFPHPRSPEALRIFAAHAGMTVGLPYAECFAIVRSVN